MEHSSSCPSKRCSASGGIGGGSSGTGVASGLIASCVARAARHLACPIWFIELIAEEMGDMNLGKPDCTPEGTVSGEIIIGTASTRRLPLSMVIVIGGSTAAGTGAGG